MFVRIPTQTLDSAHCQPYSPCMAKSIVYIFANESNPFISLHLIRFPASQFRGLSAFGSESIERMAWHTDKIVHAGVQFVFRMSRHTSPVLK